MSVIIIILFFLSSKEWSCYLNTDSWTMCLVFLGPFGLASHAGIFSGARILSLKQLLNRGQHSFPMLSQSRCTFQILEYWPWPQGNPIIMRFAWNFEKPSWPLINVRLGAAKVRFTLSDFRILRVLHNLCEGKKRRKKVTLGSGSGSRFYTITSLSVVFNLSTLYLKTVDWSLTSRI